NEEWWGLVAVKKNGNGADIIKPRLAFYNLFKPISQGRPVTVMSPVVESLSLCVSKGFTKDKLNDGVKTSLAFPGGKWWDQALRSYLLFDYVIDLGGYYDIQKVKFNWLCSGNVIAYPTIDSWVFYYSDSLMHNWKAYLPASGMTKRGESVTERYTKIYTNKVRIKGYGRNYGGIYEMEVFGKKYPGYKILSERAM
ncbi:MAG: hypothetical protein NT033_09995, partial [Candidatus Omnitrophica bacterium]|nr:hypothetical protein [Candidatus Omnitrophota bacterium]